MPLARFYLYSQGVGRVGRADTGTLWTAGSRTMHTIAREGRCYVIGVNPCVRVESDTDGLPRPRAGLDDRPRRSRVGGARKLRDRRAERRNRGRTHPLLGGSTGRRAGTSRTSSLSRRLFDPVGHYNRPDVFRLAVDTAPRPVVTTMQQ